MNSLGIAFVVRSHTAFLFLIIIVVFGQRDNYGEFEVSIRFGQALICQTDFSIDGLPVPPFSLERCAQAVIRDLDRRTVQSA